MSDCMDPIVEAFKAAQRVKLGLDQMKDEELFSYLFTLVDLVPADRLKRYTDQMLASPRLLDRIKGKQLAILAFAQTQINAVMGELTPEQSRQLLQELSAKLCP